MKYLTSLSLFFLASLFSYSQSNHSALGREYAIKELKSALTEKGLHNVVNLKEPIIKDSLTAITISETILFNIYKKSNIIQQRPYEIYHINNYWFLSGTLPKDLVGGTFQIIIDDRDCRIIRITHGK